MIRAVSIFFLVIILALCYAQVASPEQEKMNKTDQIKLPKPILKGKISLEEAILNRRSIRSYKQDQLSLEQIGQLLWAAGGITAESGERQYRTAPSAGAIYPIQIYALYKKGLFHYNPFEHSLDMVKDEDLRRDLTSVCGGQGSISQAPFVIIICGDYSKVTSRYGQRGVRYTDIETGHIAENIHLQAVALGLGSVPIGSYDDGKVREILGLGAGLDPLYIIPAGYAK
ncbi:MAG: SagB/ThcOx family dehydrogenase [Candidatus Omnitrophica bacterium]|nr:SagB/ThcOx family dehydrogenase [Candidatus Omnitrophota bacterium]